jgi:hypothetical protein
MDGLNHSRIHTERHGRVVLVTEAGMPVAPKLQAADSLGTSDWSHRRRWHVEAFAALDVAGNLYALATVNQSLVVFAPLDHPPADQAAALAACFGDAGRNHSDLTDERRWIVERAQRSIETFHNTYSGGKVLDEIRDDERRRQLAAPAIEDLGRSL